MNYLFHSLTLDLIFVHWRFAEVFDQHEDIGMRRVNVDTHDQEHFKKERFMRVRKLLYVDAQEGIEMRRVRAHEVSLGGNYVKNKNKKAT